ncbi:MAG TPA: hypothetical protein VFT59_01965 [Candidatus Saccharimonadales bacterium]|nr:hypothetical protein [Candidatus Saccharimonadales bacterium]
MDTFFQRFTHRSLMISNDGFHVIVRAVAQDEDIAGVVTIRLSARQARQLAEREMACFDDITPAPKGPFVRLWHTPLPDGSSHIAMSYSQVPDEANAAWVGVLLAAEDYIAWRHSLLLSANRVE